jgi:arylsulfatase A
MVAYMDKTVGKVVARLESLGLREKTLVVFVGDNGTAAGVRSQLGDRTIIGAKGKTTDAGTHVPLIANWPGQARAGTVCQDLVDASDFFPTLLAAAGIKPPRELALDGRSFLPQVLGEKGNPREWMYSWYARDGGATGVEYARDQRFKLYGDGRLFDVANDDLEKSPLGAASLSSEAAAAREQLQAALDRYKNTRPAEIARQGGRRARVSE